MSSHGQPSDCRLHNRSIFDPILHNPTDREREVAAQVFPILNFGKTGNYFSLSRELCDIWLSIDYMASNASVMNLLAISVDRWQNLLSSANTNISYSTTLHNVYIGQFFSFRPRAVGHIVQPRDCHLVEHIFVPTLLVERTNEKIRFP